MIREVLRAKPCESSTRIELSHLKDDAWLWWLILTKQKEVKRGGVGFDMLEGGRRFVGCDVVRGFILVFFPLFPLAVSWHAHYCVAAWCVVCFLSCSPFFRFLLATLALSSTACSAHCLRPRKDKRC